MAICSTMRTRCGADRLPTPHSFALHYEARSPTLARGGQDEPQGWLSSLLAPLLGGCTLLFSGTTQAVSVEAHSEPAEAFVDSVSLGFTPLELRLACG